MARKERFETHGQTTWHIIQDDDITECHHLPDISFEVTFEGLKLMNIDELIEQLQQLRNEHGGQLAVYYVGLNSPVNGAVIYNSSIGKVVELKGR